MFKNFQEANGFIQKTSWMGAKLDLSRITKLCALLGNPQKKLRFVHVAGTNGKGSTSAMVASVLMQAGYKTGLYTSPPLVCFGERMQVDGVNARDDEVIELAWEIKKASELMADPPTEFEVITAMSLLHFFNNKCDIVVFEVGMGGRLDATNVIDAPFVSVITTIGLDHTEFLGDTKEKIAGEKAGIIKKGTVVVSHPQEAHVAEVIKRKCQRESVEVKFVALNEIIPVKADLDGQFFMYADKKPSNYTGETAILRKTRKCTSPSLPSVAAKGQSEKQNAEIAFSQYTNNIGSEYFIPLLGEHQLQNAAAAIEVAFALQSRGLKIIRDDLCLGLGKIKWQGRFQVLRKNPPFILDAAHNPAGVETAVKTLLTLFPSKKIIFMMGVLADKDYVGMLKKLIPYATQIIFVPTEGVRGLSAAKLQEAAKDLGFAAIQANSIEAGINTATELSHGGGVVCALGSFTIVPDVLRLVSG